MNILILSCGTRNKLVRCFKENPKVNKVVAADCSELASAFYEADKKYIIPRMNEEGYFNSIVNICNIECIDIVLPLQEEELLLSAKNKDGFIEKGISILVSKYESVEICKDKYRLNRYLIENNISAVETGLVSDVDKQSFRGPLFVKPRFGAGSVGTMVVNSFELMNALNNEANDELIYQPYIRGKEYGVDIYVDLLSHEVVACFVKEKLRMRAGETEKSVSVINREISKLAIDTVMLLGLVGPIDIDILEQDGVFRVLEVNPRFGGGYPHAYECGVNFTDYIANNVNKEINTPNIYGYEEGVVALKYTDILIKNH